MSLPQDIIGVLRGLNCVAQSAIKLQESNLKTIWLNSNIRSLSQEYLSNVSKCSKTVTNRPDENLVKTLTDGADRFATVFDGIKEYAASSTQKIAYSEPLSKPDDATPVLKAEAPVSDKSSEVHIKLTPSEKALLKRLDMEHQERIKAAAAAANEAKGMKSSNISTNTGEGLKATNTNVVATNNKTTDNVKASKMKNKESLVKAVPNPKSRQSLSDVAKERTVPASRMARMFSFGSLAAGLGVGTAAEFVKRSLGLGSETSSSVLFLSPANMDRIVDTLCKVRGAALKIGQMLSLQDENTINPELARALERVRKSADFMPKWQVHDVLEKQFGKDWRGLLLEFEEKPFAAASIGQVHWGKTMNGQEIAIKIQYPGVARGITSDIDNLVGIMKVWNIFPSGLFIDNIVKVAKKELAWEVDYLREAKCTREFKRLLEPYPDFYVPDVIDNFCSPEVFTSEFVEGIPVDQCVHLDDDHRRFIANKIMELCLLELMEFRYMQTDPNWANFLYNPQTRKIVLLDFGATREYPKQFVDQYVHTMKAASDNDREMVLKYSRDIGFLTGYEDKIMENAHVDAVMILGEVFRTSGEYKFSGQDIIYRIQHLLPTVIAHRLCPPPEEIYSLHRKLSGIFLLCAKLNTSISCRDLFLKMYNNYKFDM